MENNINIIDSDKYLFRNYLNETTPCLDVSETDNSMMIMFILDV